MFFVTVHLVPQRPFTFTSSDTIRKHTRNNNRRVAPFTTTFKLNTLALPVYIIPSNGRIPIKSAYLKWWCRGSSNPEALPSSVQKSASSNLDKIEEALYVKPRDEASRPLLTYKVEVFSSVLRIVLKALALRQMALYFLLFFSFPLSLR